MSTLKTKAVRYLAKHVEEVLANQNERGEFRPDAGTHAPFNTDYQQFAYYPLAWLYVFKHPENPWTGSARLLAAVERSLLNNVALQVENGDFYGSTHDHGPRPHANNWRSFTFLRTWELLRGQLDPRLEHACEAALRKALGSVVKSARQQAAEKGFAENHHVRNHPFWYFLAAHALGSAFGDADAVRWARETYERVCAAQHPAGVWFEHEGPVAVYHHVALSALSHYHALTGLQAARAALERSLNFCRLFTYPAGHPIETLDGRTRYTGYAMSILPAAWAHLPAGRAYLHFILDRLLEQPLGGGYQVHGGWLGLPFFTTFARDLPDEEPAPAPGLAPLAGDGVHAPEGLPVRLIRQGPWTVVLSGFTRPAMPENRWCLDYQAHCSVFHEKAGLIVGGGGGKRQAAWSLFNGGVRPLGLPCLAESGSAETRGPSGALLRLNYPGFTAQLEAQVNGDAVTLAAQVDRAAANAAPEPVYLQLPFPMKGDAFVVNGTGHKYEADLQHELMPEKLGASVGREGKFTLHGLEGAQALLHLLPFNTHWRNGWAHREKAMGIVAQPLAFGTPRILTVRVP